MDLLGECIQDIQSAVRALNSTDAFEHASAVADRVSDADSRAEQVSRVARLALV